MELSIFDLSKHLGVGQDTIERWIRQGKLPVSQKGVKYRFHSRELEKWAAKHNISLNLSVRETPETKTESIIPLSQAVENGGIYFDIPGNDVQSVLNACVDKMTAIPHDFKTDLLDRLIQREQALSTGIGNGIAIPHPREQPAYLNNPLVSICFLANPVDYRALDNLPVAVLFFILCPELKLHLNLLSALSFCLRNSEFVAFLKSRPEPDLLIKKINVLQQTNPI